MGNNQALKPDDNFAVVEALYQEAELAAQTMPKPSIIMSRKPKEALQAESLFTRISDLYEEAEATRLLDDEVADTPPPSVDASDDAHQMADEFAIPADFGLPEAQAESQAEAQAESDAEQEAESKEDAALSDEELALLADTLDEAGSDTPPDDVTISDEIEPAIALDDVLEGLMPAEGEDDKAALSDEAKALAALDASRPPADDELTEQLEAVKSAVAQAHVTNHAAKSNEAADEMQEEATETSAEEAPASATDDDLDALTAGPALATFIGETVRDVLDEELPQMVRGLVDEALGERQGRYGRSDTPHIGLRTKPSRH